MSDDGLEHLEMLHQQSEGLRLPEGHRLKLDAGHLTSGRPNNQIWRMGLTFTDGVDHRSKIDVCDEGGDDLPDPHEILAESTFKPSQIRILQESNSSDSDPDMFITDAPRVVLDGGDDSSPHSKLNRRAIVSTCSVIKLNDSSISRRRPRSTVRSLSPSPSPVSKRPRIDACSGGSAMVKSRTLATSTGSIIASNFKLSSPVKAELAVNHRLKDTKSVPLFLESAFGSDGRASEGYAAVYTSENEEPVAFDMDPSTPSLSYVVPSRHTHDQTPSFVMDEDPSVGARTNSSDEDVVMVVNGARVPRDDELQGESLDDYDRAMAEFEAWFNGGYN